MTDVFGWDNTLIFLAPAISLLLTLGCVPAVRRLAAHWVCRAAEKRSLALAPDADLRRRGVLRRFCRGDSAFLPEFRIGPAVFAGCHPDVPGRHYDDLRRLNPATKLVGQIATAASPSTLAIVPFSVGPA